jgi:hypothetical protein
MTQPDMFYPPASRNTDPVTSHIAEQNHTRLGARDSVINQVRVMLRKRPFSTSSEIAEYIKPGDYKYYTLVGKRLSDLKNKGEAVQCKERACRVAGTQHVTWQMLYA